MRDMARTKKKSKHRKQRLIFVLNMGAVAVFGYLFPVIINRKSSQTLLVFLIAEYEEQNE